MLWFAMVYWAKLSCEQSCGVAVVVYRTHDRDDSNAVAPVPLHVSPVRARLVVSSPHAP